MENRVAAIAVLLLAGVGQAGCAGPSVDEGIWALPDLRSGERFVYAPAEGGATRLELQVGATERIQDAFGKQRPALRVQVRDNTSGLQVVGDVWLGLHSRLPLRQLLAHEASPDRFQERFYAPQYGYFAEQVLIDRPQLAAPFLLREPLRLGEARAVDVHGVPVQVRAERDGDLVSVRVEHPRLAAFGTPEPRESTLWFEAGTGLPVRTQGQDGGWILLEHSAGGQPAPWEPFAPEADPAASKSDGLFPTESSLPFPLARALESAQRAPGYLAFAAQHLASGGVDGVSAALYEATDPMGARRWTLQFFAMEGSDPDRMESSFHDVAVAEAQGTIPVVVAEGNLLPHPDLHQDPSSLVPAGLVPLDAATRQAHAEHADKLLLTYGLHTDPSTWNTSLEAVVEYASGQEEPPLVARISAVNGQVLSRLRLPDIEHTDVRQGLADGTLVAS